MVQQKLAQKQKAAPDMSDLLYVITGCGMGYMGSMEHPKCLGDIMESAIGAVYLDTGMDVGRTYPVCTLFYTSDNLDNHDSFGMMIRMGQCFASRT